MIPQGRLLCMKELWAETIGSPEVVVAVLDGPADLSHPYFAIGITRLRQTGGCAV